MQQKRYHLIVDLEHVPDDVMTDVEGLRGFLKEFPPKIGMSVLHGPEVVEGIPENPGLSGFVIIDYSHISVHTFSKFGEALADVFSCKPFDKETTVNVVLEYFKVGRKDARVKEVFWG